MAHKKLNEDLNFIQRAPLEIQTLDGDLNIIQKLDDEPNDVGGLTSAELKAEFDKAGNTIKTYLNETLIPAILASDATERERTAAEAQRAEAETKRAEAETKRAAAETARGQAETARAQAESAREVWEPYNGQRAYVPGNKVFYEGSSFVCTAPAQGILPTEKSHWTMIVEKGDSGSGTGDMHAYMYDPTRQRRDVFAAIAEAVRQQDEKTQTALDGKQKQLSGQAGQVLGFDDGGRPIPVNAAQTALPAGGKTGDVLVKKSETEGEAEWSDLVAALPKVHTMKWIGDGKEGKTLFFPFPPDLVFVWKDGDYNRSFGIVPSGRCINGSSNVNMGWSSGAVFARSSQWAYYAMYGSSTIIVTFSDNSMEMKDNGSYTTGYYVYNDSGSNYKAIAIKGV